jgi:2-polyprenyl-3-methyl-5-hydroxy-6-metoxy-1,4-benzoquinol methylase
MEQNNYLEVNKHSWNNRVDAHVNSEFYNMEGFLKGETSLKSIELNLLGDIRGKKVLHLQCHFGQDTISLSRMGAIVTGIDLSDKAIDTAKKLAKDLNTDTQFICCDIFDLPNHLDEKFDIVFTSYGTIGWLPDMNKWANIVAHFKKPEGKFIFVEFHPAVWMYDDDFKMIYYNYFNTGPIVEVESGTYADKTAEITQKYVMWNHGMSEVVNSLIASGLKIERLDEFNYSPYPCFKHTVKVDTDKYYIEAFGDKFPMVYAIVAS